MSLATKLFDLLGINKGTNTPYWLKITTKVPKCIYYFGPFDSLSDAKASQAGYIEDLIEEKAQGIYVELQQSARPTSLTICENKDE